MRTQLLISFGFLVVVVFGCFIGIWASAVFSLKDTLIRSSKKYLTEQIGLIGIRMTSEVNDVFDAKMKMAASSFLYPVAFGLYDAYDSASLTPLPTYAASQLQAKCADPLMCLRVPASFDNRDPDKDLGSFRCGLPTDPSADVSFKAMCSDWNGVSTTDGGCNCKGKKTISQTASSVFVTGMDGSEAVALEQLNLFRSDRDKSSFFDALVSESWSNNLDWIQVYLGIKHLEVAKTSMFRSYPGSVRELLSVCVYVCVRVCHYVSVCTCMCVCAYVCERECVF